VILPISEPDTSTLVSSPQKTDQRAAGRGSRPGWKVKADRSVFPVEVAERAEELFGDISPLAGVLAGARVGPSPLVQPVKVIVSPASSGRDFAAVLAGCADHLNLPTASSVMALLVDVEGVRERELNSAVLRGLRSRNRTSSQGCAKRYSQSSMETLVLAALLSSTLPES